jgi:hypothetical protein
MLATQCSKPAAFFFLGLDPATGELAPEAVSLDDEAASVLRGKCGEPYLVCTPFLDEHMAALNRICGPCSREIEGMRLSDNAQAYPGSECEFEVPVHARSPWGAISRLLAGLLSQAEAQSSRRV